MSGHRLRIYLDPSSPLGAGVDAQGNPLRAIVELDGAPIKLRRAIIDTGYPGEPTLATLDVIVESLDVEIDGLGIEMRRDKPLETREIRWKDIVEGEQAA